MSTISESEYQQRVRALEELNKTLAAEIDRQRAEYNAEVDEFNAGYEAAQQGLPESAEPSDTKYDVWKCGYAWAMFDKLKAEVDLMRPVVEATITQVNRNDDRFSWYELKKAVNAYEAAKNQG